MTQHQPGKYHIIYAIGYIKRIQLRYHLIIIKLKFPPHEGHGTACCAQPTPPLTILAFRYFQFIGKIIYFIYTVYIMISLKEALVIKILKIKNRFQWRIFFIIKTYSKCSKWYPLKYLHLFTRFLMFLETFTFFWQTVSFPILLNKFMNKIFHSNFFTKVYKKFWIFSLMCPPAVLCGKPAF